MLSLPRAWAWDFWIADDGQDFHLYFLNAPHSLGDADLRHRAARIGHATSSNLIDWTFRNAPVIEAGAKGEFDDTATWTGCVVRGDDGLWRMFYTGSRFLYPEPNYANIETVGVATSTDLITWVKQPGPITQADARWYETYTGAEGTWKEEAWRDPWVFRDPEGDGWHMLVTARANEGDLDNRGVIGHAWSADLTTWEVRPPLSTPGSGFAHLEVPQVAEIGGQWFLIFSCGEDALSADNPYRADNPGTWALALTSPTEPYSIPHATPLTTAAAYSGRLVTDRAGDTVLIGFDSAPGGVFPGTISDPVPVIIADGRLKADTPELAPTA